MKCDCPHCNGTGSIRCPDCGGNGALYIGIEKVDLHLHRKNKNHTELVELQGDAKRVIRQAAELTELKPNYAESYKRQLGATLAKINLQATALLEGKKK